MQAKPADPTAIIRDPITKRALPAAGGDVPDNSFWTRRALAGVNHDAEIWVLAGDTWTRRMRDGSITREIFGAPAPSSGTEPGAPSSVPAPHVQPAGNEPVAPLTTR